MSPYLQWRNEAEVRAALRGWRRNGRIDRGATARADAALGLGPARSQWLWFLERSALWLGVALLAAGAICFIAANWEHLDRSARLYGMQGVLIFAVAAAARLGLARIAGQAALWLATILLGGLLALIGQTYQTGADTWELFALWAVLALPWAIACRHQALWLSWAILLNVSCGLWLNLNSIPAFLHIDDDAPALGLLNLLVLAAWQMVGTRWAEFSGLTGRRVLAAAMIAFASFGAATGILDERAQSALVIWGLVTLVAGVYFLRIRRDLPVLAMLALGAIAVISTALAYQLLEDHASAGRYLVIAFAVIVQATLAAFALRRLARGGVA